MNRAKAFFFVCAGLFLLTLTYQLGARSAGAQSGSAIDGASLQAQPYSSETPIAAGVVGRIFTYLYLDAGSTPFVIPVPIPGAQRVIATNPLHYVLLENGDVLHYNGVGWDPVGNLLGGAVNVEKHTLGQLKQRFRTPPAGR